MRPGSVLDPSNRKLFPDCVEPFTIKLTFQPFVQVSMKRYKEDSIIRCAEKVESNTSFASYCPSIWLFVSTSWMTLSVYLMSSFWYDVFTRSLAIHRIGSPTRKLAISLRCAIAFHWEE